MSVASNAPSQIEPKSDEMLEIDLIGRLQVRHNNRRLSIKSRKAEGIIAFLALQQGNSESRERLAGLMWSEVPENRARTSLRQIVRLLDKSLHGNGQIYIQIERNILSLDPSRIRIDIQVIENLIRQGSIPGVLLTEKHLCESLLYGLEDLDPAFRSWLLVQRENFHKRLIQALESLINCENSDTVTARCRREAARAVLNLEPSNEPACQALMRMHVENGDISAALRCYRELWDLLAEEYDTEPSLETQKLLVNIKSSSIDAHSGNIISRDTQRRVWILVRSIDTKSLTPVHANLLKGFRHALIATLSRFREWLIGDQDGFEATPKIDPKNGDTYILDISVLEQSGLVNLVLTLDDADSGACVWGEIYNRETQNWLRLQRLIINRLAMTLNIKLSEERQRLIHNLAETDITLFDRWQRGQALFLSYESVAWDEATKIFTSIVKSSPNFSRAYSSLTQLENSRHLVFAGFLRSASRQEIALNYARRAVRADPGDTRAHLALAWSAMLNGQFIRASIALEQSIGLNESDPWTLVSVALGFGFAGHTKKALYLLEQATDMGAPYSNTHWGYIGTARFVCGDYKGCVAALERAENAILNLPAWHAAALIQLDSRAEAIRLASDFIDIAQKHWCRNFPADEEKIIQWFLHSFPLQSDAVWSKLRDSLSQCGLTSSSKFDPSIRFIANNNSEINDIKLEA